MTLEAMCIPSAACQSNEAARDVGAISTAAGVRGMRDTRQRTKGGKRRALAGLLLAASALAGCVPDAIVPDPALDVPGSYRYAGSKGGLRDHATDWWSSFHSPELTRLMEETEVENLDIAAAIGQVEQADAMARQSGAALFPTLSASDTVTRSLSSGAIFNGTSSGGAGAGSSATSTTTTTSSTGMTASGTGPGTPGTVTGTGTGTGMTTGGTGTTGTGTGGTTTTTTAGSSASALLGTSSNTPTTILNASFAASYQLDLFGRNRALYKSAQDAATATRWNRQTVQLTSLASTATTYLTIVANRERIAFAKQDVKDSDGILNLIRLRQTAGTATDLDVAQQAALVANLKASIPPLEVVVNQNIAALAILLGTPPERVRVSGSTVLKAFVPTIAPGIPSEVLTLRPDVEMAEATLGSAHANLVAARAAFFPTINLTAQGGFESLALKTLFSPASTFYSIAGNLAQPIFDGGLLQAEFDLVKGQQDTDLANYRKAVITAFSDVDKALTALKLYAQQEELTKQSLVASRRAYDLSRQRLEQGVLDVVTLLQTEQTLFTTQDTLVQVRLLRLMEAVALYQALGGAYAGRIKGGT